MLSKERELKYVQLEALAGNTPLHRISSITIPNRCQIFAKEEWKNPTGSIFDRVYPHLFRIAEEEGKIAPGITPVIEVSTGNAGASFAWCARELGYNDCTVIIHEDAPKVRIKQIESYGAKIIFSPGGQYAKGYVQKLQEILSNDKRVKGGRIGENLERLYCVTKIHPRAKEVYKKFVDEVLKEGIRVDYFLGVVGSGTSISGIGKHLKLSYPTVKVIAVDIAEAPFIYSLKREGAIMDYDCMPHDIWGSTPFGLPLNRLNLDLDVIDEVVLVTKEEREKSAQLLFQVEGKQVGRTSCCVFAAAYNLALQEIGSNILICFYDPAWKYETAEEFK